MDYNIFSYIYLAHHITGWSNSRGEIGMGVSIILRTFFSATPPSMAAGSNSRIYGSSCGHTKVKGYVVTCWHALTVHPSLHASFSLFGQ